MRVEALDVWMLCGESSRVIVLAVYVLGICCASTESSDYREVNREGTFVSFLYGFYCDAGGQYIIGLT